MNRFPAGVAIARQVPSETEPSPRARTAAGCGGVGLGPPASEGTLFISRQVFCVTGSDPARFGGGHLSEFAPATACPYCGIERPENPQVGANHIIWSRARLPSLPRKAPRRGFETTRNPHIGWVSCTATQNRAHSEQAVQRTGHIPYRLANSLLNAVLMKRLLYSAFATGSLGSGLSSSRSR